jgi:hypothetical protein
MWYKITTEEPIAARMPVLHQLALILLLTAHLLCVNVAAAGPLVAMWLDWREGRGDKLCGTAGRFLTWESLALLAVGACLGLTIGWMQWDQAYRRAILQFDRRVFFAVWELAFSLGLMTMAAVWWTMILESRPLGRGVRMFLQFLAGTNLLYHFPLLFIVISDVSTAEASLSKSVDSADFRSLIVTGSVMSRAVHVCLASFAVTGVALIAHSEWLQRRGTADAARIAVWGGRLALVVTILQLPVGVWLLSQLPSRGQRLVLGGDPIATSLLGISILLALWLMHLLAAIALGDTTRKNTRLSVAVMVVTVLLMSGVLVRLG